MKTILLNTPSTDNGGTRRDAGEQLTVGEEAGEIALNLAQALVAASSAVDVTPPEKPAKKAD